MVVLMGSIAFASCDSDDDDGSVVGGQTVVGTWEAQGSTSTSYQRITFSKDGTGCLITENGSQNFKYTYSYDSSSSTGSLKYWFLDSSTIYNRTITITGKTMMMKGNSTSIWNRI